jgi:hypothetical protein
LLSTLRTENSKETVPSKTTNIVIPKIVSMTIIHVTTQRSVATGSTVGINKHPSSSSPLPSSMTKPIQCDVSITTAEGKLS